MEKKNRIYILLTAVILIVSIGVVTVGVRSLLRNRAMDAALALVPSETVPEPTEIVREVEVVKVVEKEKVITGEMLQEGLNKMGFLITQEYYLTEVLHYSDVRCVPVFQWKIPLGESSSVFSYDCQVDAGIDFEKIRVDMDEEQKVITVSVPTAELRPPLVVHDSFQLYSEKNNVFIPVGNQIADRLGSVPSGSPPGAAGKRRCIKNNRAADSGGSIKQQNSGDTASTVFPLFFGFGKGTPQQVLTRMYFVKDGFSLLIR